MCGIYGITDHNPTLIQNYIRTCRHRGPDADKIWWDPQHKLTMGHNLLSIMSDPKLSHSSNCLSVISKEFVNIFPSSFFLYVFNSSE